MANQYSQFVDSADEETQKKRQALQDRLAANQQPVDTKVERPEYYLGELQRLATDPQYQAEAPPESRKSLADAMDQADKLYQQKSNINDWAEVGSMLARAVAQYGAARAGAKSGVDMSGLKFDPGIDWKARTDRAARDRDAGISNLEKLSNVERQEWADRETRRRQETGARKDWAEAGLSTSREDRRLAQQLAKDASKEKDDKRINRTLAVMKDQEAKLFKQEQAAELEAEAFQELADKLQSEGMSKKTLLQWEKDNPKLARASGQSLTELAKQLEEQETFRPGFLGGKTKEQEQTDKQNILNNILQGKLSKLQEARSKREQLSSTREKIATGALSVDELGTQQPEQSAQEIKKASKAQVAEYAKQYNMTEEQAAKHLQNNGYTIE